MTHLSQLSHQNIYPLTTETNAFLLIKDNRESRRIEIPLPLKSDPTIEAMRELVNSYYFYRTISTQRFQTYFHTLSHFLDCFSEPSNQLQNDEDPRLPLDTGQKFICYLIEMNFSEFTIFNHLTNLKVLLKSTLSAKCSDVVNLTIEDWQRTHAILESWPYIAQPEKQESRKGVADKFGVNCSEIEILMSLKLFCAWFLTECSLIREQFKENCPADYQWLLSLAKDNNSKWILSEPVSTNNNRKDKKRIGRKVYAMMLRSARSIPSPLYLETVFFNGILKILGGHGDEKFKRFTNNLSLEFPNPAIEYMEWNREHTVNLLNSFINTEGLAYRRTIKVNTKREFFDPKKIFTPLGLLIPSLEEQIAMAWLLASERVQQSNLERIRLSDVEFIEGSGKLHISTFKGRNNTTVSCVYSKTQPAFDAISRYKKDLCFAYTQGLLQSGGVQDNALFIPNIKYHHFAIHHNKHSALMFLPMVVRGSETQAAYFRFCGNAQTAGQADHFLDCLLNAYTLNADFSRSRTRQKIEQRPAKASEETESGDNPSQTKTSQVNRPSSIYLSPQNIAQSCVLGNDAENARATLNNMTRSPNMSVNLRGLKNIHRDIHARRMRHNTSTEAAYADFSQCRIKLQADDRFGELVGAEMYLMANTLAGHMTESTHLLSLGEVDQLLHIKTVNSPGNIKSATLIFEQAELQNYSIDKVGLFSKDGHTFIIKIPLIAALLDSKIKHLESQIETLISSNPLRVKRSIALLIFYKSILNNFDPKIRRQAIEQYGHFQFDFADLTV
ncbi:hypothetical protein JFU48_24940 [Pseudomonas sp. TH49]|uniref:hypothetical protein n=1 Tax=Pseudomonas sp. TH49 TaxID=2796413 RepID=UPI0019144B10|nr:hypothetical protein [Pseudomonas sp. TH49]MBK5344623.1 hypothetical protein [Pseudomonas sp. TH49]